MSLKLDNNTLKHSALWTIIKEGLMNPLFFLGLMGFLHLWLLWPGMLTPDSETQYQIALSGLYSDHHPPLMSFVWRYLDKIYPGPGLLLLMHLVLLYASVWYLMKSLRGVAGRYFVFLLPFIPQVLVYSGMIWKDVGFALSFLWVGSYLTYLTSRKAVPQMWEVLAMSIVLLYGTAIKFQAQYCAPLFLGWLTFSLMGYKLEWRRFVVCFFLIGFLFYTSLFTINRTLVSTTSENHSWQYVKLFDLAAMSVETQEPLFPDHVKTENFSMENLTKRHQIISVDDLVWKAPSLLHLCSNEGERNALWMYWAKTVITHPLSYLKHRASVLYVGLRSIPTPARVIAVANMLNETYHPFLGTALFVAYKTVGSLIFSHLLTLVLCIAYISLALRSLRQTWAAIPLLFFNGTGLAMVLTLFFFSMAGTPRYTYVLVCMVNASHLFAFLCSQAVGYNEKMLRLLPKKFVLFRQ